MPLTEEQLKYGELLSTMEHPLPVTADLFAAAVAEIRLARAEHEYGKAYHRLEDTACVLDYFLSPPWDAYEEFLRGKK